MSVSSSFRMFDHHARHSKTGPLWCGYYWAASNNRDIAICTGTMHWRVCTRFVWRIRCVQVCESFVKIIPLGNACTVSRKSLNIILFRIYAGCVIKIMNEYNFAVRETLHVWASIKVIFSILKISTKDRYLDYFVLIFLNEILWDTRLAMHNTIQICFLSGLTRDVTVRSV